MQGSYVLNDSFAFSIMINYLYRDILQATQVLRQGGIIAYPTEFVFGLGCDPYNEKAINRLLMAKARSTITQGFVLVACNWDQVNTMISPITQKQFDIVNKTWPGNNTWLFPKKPSLPLWITGGLDTVAIRIPDHPVPKLLAETFNNLVISTSANIHGESPCKTKLDVQKKLGNNIDYIVEGEIGKYNNTSVIRDLVTLQVLRN